MILGKDNRHNLDESIDTFTYDGNFFLRVYNLLEGPTLCMGKVSFLNSFLYSCFEYDFVDYASYGGRSYLSREGEVYLKFVMILLIVHLMGVELHWVES